MEPPTLKDVLRSVTVEPGVLFVMIAGIFQMLRWHVDNLDLVPVKQKNNNRDTICCYVYILLTKLHDKLID